MDELVEPLPQPAAGDQLAGGRLVKVLQKDTFRQVWRADAEGGPHAVYVLDPAVGGEGARRFHAHSWLLRRLATQSGLRVLRVHELDPGARAYRADLWTVGTMADLPALGWDLERRLAFFRSICATVSALHASGSPHGCLNPSAVLLDDALEPVIADVLLFDALTLLDGAETKPFVAPELEAGEAPSVGADVFALGQILYFVLAEATPAEARETVPRLDTIAAVAPAGLVRIVRKAVSSAPSDRYADVKALLDDVTRYGAWESVGRGHPAVQDANKTTAFAAAAARAEPNAAPISLRPARATTLRPPPGSAAVAAPPRAKTLTSAPDRKTESRPQAKPEATKPEPRKTETKSSAVERPSLMGPDLDPTGPGWLRYVGLLGILAALGVLFGAYSTGSMAFLWSLLFSLATGAGTQVVTLSRAGRVTAAVVGTAAGFLLDFAGTATVMGAEAAVVGSDAVAAAAAARTLIGQGRKNFDNAQLAQADFSKRNLASFSFVWADLSGANLEGSDLSSSKMECVNLSNANLKGANLQGADVRMARFAGATCDKNTALPGTWVCVDGKVSE
jgi:hypothetical protein